MKNFKFLLVLSAFSICLVTSCKQDKKVETKPGNSQVKTNENPKETAMLNPEHGVDGHRCDLPVGASLKDAPAVSPNTITPGVSPVYNSAYQSAKNPAHGQPGHDCSKPVGADL